MVSVERQGDTLQINLQSNCSASWKQTKYAVALISGVAIAVAIFWAANGLWAVLPFTGLEVFLLAFFAYKVCAKTHHRQVIILRKDEIEVQWGNHFPKRRWLFNRYASEFEILKPRHSLSPDGLRLRQGDRFVVIGNLLNKEEVRMVINEFKAAGLPFKVKGEVSTVAIDGFNY